MRFAERRLRTIQVRSEKGQSPPQAVGLRQVWIQCQGALHLLHSTLLVVRFHAGESHQHVGLGGIAVLQDTLDHEGPALVVPLMQQCGTKQVSESEVVRISVGQRIEQYHHAPVFTLAEVAF